MRKFPPFTDADADALVRQLHLAVDNIKIVDELIDILEVGDNFLSDDVTRNGELTVSNDLSLDADQTRIVAVFTIARAHGWIHKIKTVKSQNPRRKSSQASLNEVMPRGREVAPTLRAAMERYRKELS